MIGEPFAGLSIDRFNATDAGSLKSRLERTFLDGCIGHGRWDPRICPLDADANHTFNEFRRRAQTSGVTRRV